MSPRRRLKTLELSDPRDNVSFHFEMREILSREFREQSCALEMREVLSRESQEQSCVGDDGDSQ